jgi:hypothetical protein
MKLDRYQKRLVKDGIVIPIIIAVIATILFYSVFQAYKPQLPFVDEVAKISDYEKSDVQTAQAVIIDSETISKYELPALESNTIVGNIEVNGNSMELIYDADDINAVGRMNISNDSKFVGEVGQAYISCYKEDNDFVKSLKVGDVVNVDMYYGSYQFKVSATANISSASLAKKQGDGYGRAIVLYTDAENEIGISDNYATAVCEMTDGIAVVQ